MSMARKATNESLKDIGRLYEKKYYDRCMLAIAEHFQLYNDMSFEQIEEILKQKLNETN